MPIPEHDYDPTPERLRDIQRHVAHLIDTVATVHPRDFEAAAERGERWAYTISHAIWGGVDLLETALFPHFPARVNNWPGRQISTWGWPAYVQAALDRLLAVTEEMILRWRAPAAYPKLREAKGDDPALGDDPDRGTRDPIIERDELNALRWVDGELTRALARLEGERPTEGDGGGDGPSRPDSDTGPAGEMSEADLVIDLYKAGWQLPANLVGYMIGRASATLEEVMDAVYGDSEGREESFRKVKDRANEFLTEKESKMRYVLKSGRLFKEIASE